MEDSTMKAMFKCFMLAVLMLFSIDVCQAKMYGVFYATNGKDLNCPENDVTDLAKLYRERGGNVILIRGDGVTRKVVLSSIRKQVSYCNQNDIIMFAYSGHGNNGFIECGSNEIIKFSEIKHEMSLAKAKRKVLFIDACYSGSASDGGGLIQGNNDDSNVLIFTASKSNQMSSEINGDRNSVFYSALLPGLEGKADKNNDGKVSAKEIYNYVKAHSLFQEPTMIGKFDENMTLATVRGEVNLEERNDHTPSSSTASALVENVANVVDNAITSALIEESPTNSISTNNKKEDNNFMGISILTFSWLSFVIGIIATIFGIWLVFKVIQLILRFINWVCGNVL